MDQGLSERVNAGRQRLLDFADAIDLREAVPVRIQFLLFLLLFAILPTRRLGLFIHPNFYAEDAQVWFVQAYSGGWLHSLTLPEAGYLNTLQRLLTGLALIVPFHLAPLVDAVLGLLLQILPVPILLSARCRNWSPLSVRCMFAGLYALFPNGNEIHVVLTNSQWHLALVLLLLAFAEPPRTNAGKVLGAAFFLLAGFCGPFGILLVPLLVLLWIYKRPKTWAVIQAVCLTVGSSAQVYELLRGPARYHAYLGATLKRFLHILGAEVFVGSVSGGHHQFIHMHVVATLLGLVAGTAVTVYCMRFAPVPLRLLTLYSGLMLAVALHAPLIYGPKPLWDLLIDDPICRYWFLPGLAFLWGCAWCARKAASAWMQRMGTVVMLLTCLGIVASWPYTNFKNYDFPTHAREFEQAQPGTHVRIPIYPEEGRYVELVKH